MFKFLLFGIKNGDRFVELENLVFVDNNDVQDNVVHINFLNEWMKTMILNIIPKNPIIRDKNYRFGAF